MAGDGMSPHGALVSPDPSLRAPGDPRRLHQTGEGLPAWHHLHRRPEKASHPALLRRQEREGERCEVPGPVAAVLFLATGKSEPWLCQGTVRRWQAESSLMSETCCSVDTRVHTCRLGCFWKARQLLGVTPSTDNPGDSLEIASISLKTSVVLVVAAAADGTG